MDYPARLEVEIPEKIARRRPLFQWILAIPHFIVGAILMWVAEIVSLIAWFAILFTGKLPAGLANFTCMALRYNSRNSVYAMGLHAQYPPFAFETTAADPGGNAARVDFTPSLEGRNRLTCALRIIWAIPVLIVTLIIGLIAYICWFIGAIAVLFTGAWPAGLRDWVLKGQRASLRCYAYLFLLTDAYPPLSFD